MAVLNTAYKNWTAGLSRVQCHYVFSVVCLLLWLFSVQFVKPPENDKIDQNVDMLHDRPTWTEVESEDVDWDEMCINPWGYMRTDGQTTGIKPG